MKLPLVLESEIFLRSQGEKPLKAKSKVLGARNGDFILIDTPAFRINEKEQEGFNGDIVCSFFHEGDVYCFLSRIQSDLEGGLTFIEYPDHFHVRNIRKHQRIRVHIDAQLHLPNDLLPAKASMLDISEGGCYLVVPSVAQVVRNSLCQTDFVLPDDQHIASIQARVRSIQTLRLREMTGLGLEFVGPQDQLERISSFCKDRMFFQP